MTASDVDKIIPFPGARGRPGDRGGEGRAASTAGRARGGGESGAVSTARWEIVTPLLGWGGTVLALAAPEGPEGPEGPVFYAGATAGCFRSTDGGKTWQAANDGLTSP
jgi:hypothetical protein